MLSTLSLLAVSTAYASPPSGVVDLATDFQTEVLGAQTWNGYDQLGHALATGDLNGDGHLDLVASALKSEFVHIHFGPLPNGDTNVANSDAYFQGLQGGGEAGWAVTVGDLTGDGQDDLIVSEPSANNGAGQVVVVKGPLTGGNTWYDINSSEVEYVFEGPNAATTAVPWYVAWEMAIGDYDGDGQPDLALGVCTAADEDPELGDPTKRPLGMVSLVTHNDLMPYQGGGAMNLETDSTSIVWGLGSTGCAIDNAGDTNQDGFDDIVVGSWQLGFTNPFARAAGAVTLIEGREAWSPEYRLASSYQASTFTLSVMTGFYTLTGAKISGQQTGKSVAGVGDVNGDGFDDFMVGAPGYQTVNSRGQIVAAPSTTEGRAYLVYGAPDSTGLVGTSELETVAGVSFEGAHTDHLGIDVNGSLDLDGDGSTELLVGGLDGAGYLFMGVHDPNNTTSYACGMSGGCTVTTPSGHLSGSIALGSEQASFSGASSSNSAGSPGNYAGKVLIGSGDLTGSGTPSLVIGASAMQGYGPSAHPGHVYVIEAN